MTDKIRNILIIGAGRAGTALIKMFKDDPAVAIIGVVDQDTEAKGYKLAQQLKIPVARHWKEFIKSGALDEVIDVTGQEDVHQALAREKPENTILVSGLMARALWFLGKEHEEVEQKIQDAKEEVEAHEWGMQKTNEAIKTLYAELEAKNKELQELDRMKSDFISTVSHELRTPLAITKEGISLIQDGVLGHINSKQAKTLTTVKDSIDRLSRLIASLLDISKIEGGHGEIDRSQIAINEIVQQVVAFFEAKAADKGLALRTKLPGHSVEAYADGDKIVQVLTNLVGNSLKFTEDGFIEIDVEEKDNEIECSVTDTGKGVPKENLSKMFDKFQQINREHGDGERGTGLGLSIAKSIIEMHDGEIWAESEINKGTKVLFTLPRYTEEALLREYVNKGLEEAQKHKTEMSLLMVSIDEPEKTKKHFSEEEIYTILKGIEAVMKNSLNGSGGAALKNSRKCIAVLPGSGKQAVLSAEGRLKQAVDDYLTREKLSKKIKLRFGCATYPGEASNCEELIRHAQDN